MISHPRKISDIRDEDLSPEARDQIRQLVEMGNKREHLILAADGQVYVDEELIGSDVFHDFLDKNES